MTPTKLRTRTLRGEISATDPDSCQPLHDIVGLDLCSEFKTMYDVDLSNGHTVRVFRHQGTREWLHLDATEPGLAYEYTHTGRYQPVPLGYALLRTYRAWRPGYYFYDRLGPDPYTAHASDYDFSTDRYAPERYATEPASFSPDPDGEIPF
jgi:hypothetical protein